MYCEARATGPNKALAQGVSTLRIDITAARRRPTQRNGRHLSGGWRPFFVGRREKYEDFMKSDGMCNFLHTVLLT